MACLVSTDVETITGSGRWTIERFANVDSTFEHTKIRIAGRQWGLDVFPTTPNGDGNMISLFIHNYDSQPARVTYAAAIVSPTGDALWEVSSKTIREMKKGCVFGWDGFAPRPLVVPSMLFEGALTIQVEITVLGELRPSPMVAPETGLVADLSKLLSSANHRHHTIPCLTQSLRCGKQ